MLIRSVMNLTSLSSFNIGSLHEWAPLPDKLFQNLTTLKRIKFNCEGLESLPEGLQYLYSLRKLYLMYCPDLLTLMVNGLQGLSSLQRLWIQNC